MNRNLLIVSLVVLSTYVRGCNRTPAERTPPVPGAPVAARSPKPIKDVYSVEDLLANRQDFAHTMVKVSGCFWSDVGAVSDNAESLLKQCGRASPRPGDLQNQRVYRDFYDHVISVDNAELRYQMKKSKLNARDPEELEALKRLPKVELLFDYDEKRNSQAWQKLMKGLSPNYSLTDDGTEVVLLGQFETSSLHVAPTSNGLILADVLSKKATTTR